MKKEPETRTLSIGFGAMCGTIAQQLKKQKLKYNPEQTTHFEKLNDCITRLMFASILTDSEIKKTRHKLFKKIEQHVKKFN